MKPSLVIAGLGNPGASYENTRHNAGFLAIDALSEAFGQGDWKDAQKFASVSQEARIVAAPVLLLKPQKYMNLSGEALHKVVDFYKLDAKTQILVLSDDIDIPLGELRFRKSGGPGTHNGLKSIVEQFGEDFPRLRIGIGPKGAGDLATWVLSTFTPEERTLLSATVKKIPEMVKEYVMESAK